MTKTGAVLALRRREEGATLAELVAATGWLPHHARGANRLAQEGPRPQQARARRRHLLPDPRRVRRARLADRLTALETMPAAALAVEWAGLGQGPAPAVPPELLRRLLAHLLQERRHGALPVAVARELEREPSGGAATRPPPVALRPGTRLVREWNGRTISVLAT